MNKKNQTWKKKAPHKRGGLTSESVVWSLLAALAAAADGLALAQILSLLS